MSQYLRRVDVFNVVHFDGTTPPMTWDSNCHANQDSPTGFCYGSLDYEPLPENSEFMRRKGFVIPIKCSIVFNVNGDLITVLSQESFNAQFYPILY